MSQPDWFASLRELSREDIDALDADGIDRYHRYRRTLDPADALAAAKAWRRNRAEQRSRRLGHTTGATGWVDSP